ncbi:MAG: SLC26A/SulP transporter family protein [Cyanophyceae cyanobacterium]
MLNVISNVIDGATPLSKTLFQAPLKSIQQELSPPRLIPGLAAGAIAGIIGISLSLSFAILIFSGALGEFAPLGIGLALFGGLMVSGLVAIFSSGHAIAVPQETPAAVLAILESALVVSLGPDATPEELLVHVTVMIALSTALVGMSCFLLGWLKLGAVVRFVPYPVIGGFLAGTGWLLCRGAIAVTADFPLEWGTIPDLFRIDVLPRWLSAVAFAVVLTWLSKKYDHWSVIPGSLAVVIVLFHTSRLIGGISMEGAYEAGWLLDPIPSGSLWRPIPWDQLQSLQWGAVFDNIEGMGTVVVLSLLDLLLTVSGIELAVGDDIKIDRELKAVGAANLAASFGAGFPCYTDPSLSILPSKLKGSGRVAGLVTALFFAFGLQFGSILLAAFPKPVLGGMIMFFGLTLLIEWTWETARQMPLSDYGIVLLILTVIAFLGVLPGIVFGAIAAILLFAVKYSRIGVTKREFSGKHLRSNVERSPAQLRWLNHSGDSIYILELHGFIFFGTAHQLLDRLRGRIDDPHAPPLKFAVLDFHRVRGLDSSASVSFLKLCQLAKKYDIDILFSHLERGHEAQLRKSGILKDSNPHRIAVPDLDRALEICENHLLKEAPEEVTEDHTSTSGMLGTSIFLRILDGENQIEQILPYFKTISIDKNQHLFRQGDRPDGLYFLVSGRVSVWLEPDHGKAKRLRKFTPGTVLGELGLYQNAPRSASIIGDRPSHLFYLSGQAFERMEKEAPELASAFHRFIVKSIAERLGYREKEIQRLW